MRWKVLRRQVSFWRAKIGLNVNSSFESSSSLIEVDSEDNPERNVSTLASKRGLTAQGELRSNCLDIPADVKSTLKQLSDIGLRPEPGQNLRAYVESIERCLAEIDRRVARQLNAVIHNSRFKKLESAWCGVRYLVNQTPIPPAGQHPGLAPVRILMFQMSISELVHDLTDDLEVDRTALFQKLYTNHYGMPGGQPIGLLIGDYEFEPTNTSCQVLAAVGQIAAAAFCPFIAGASPKFWRVDSFAELQYADLIEHGTIPERLAVAWNNLRLREESRFVGLTTPRILMRKPYGYQSYDGLITREKRLLRFQEECEAPDLSGMLWGVAAWAFAEVAIREFLQTRWFGEMMAVENINRQGSRSSSEFLPHGIVVSLPELCFQSDRAGLQPKQGADLVVDEIAEEIFIKQGFLALASCPGGPYSAFFSAPSIQLYQIFDRAGATSNAKLSATLDAMLCVSRFAHYVKKIESDWLGSYASAEELEGSLQNWVSAFVSSDAGADSSADRRAEFPLTGAAVKVVAIPGKEGAFKCQMLLRPRMTPDGLVASIRLTTEFVSSDSAAN